MHLRGIAVLDGGPVIGGHLDRCLGEGCLRIAARLWRLVGFVKLALQARLIRLGLVGNLHEGGGVRRPVPQLEVGVVGGEAAGRQLDGGAASPGFRLVPPVMIRAVGDAASRDASATSTTRARLKRLIAYPPAPAGSRRRCWG